MIREHLISALEKALPYEPTDGQRRLFGALATFILQPEDQSVLLIKGFSGTGKTSALSAMVKVLNNHRINATLMAPTGRAAKVMSGYTGHEAFTVHKVIYRQKSVKDGFGRFDLDYNKAFQTFFVVDESSMIQDHSPDSSVFGSGKLLDDLFSYVFSGKQCKLILVGDTAQLPPVGLDISPALDKLVLERYGYPVTEIILDEVVRQSKGSGILLNATALREKISSHNFNLPLFTVRDSPEVVRIEGREMIELLEDYYQDNTADDAVIIVRSNKMANKYNAGIRQQILFREEEIAVGDRIMVVKNNYFWMPTEERFIANGDIFEVGEIIDREERYGRHFAGVVLLQPGNPDIVLETKVILDTLTTQTPALTSEENKALFYQILEDDPEQKKSRKAYDRVRTDPYFNALQIKFAYAITCHKAQGGQWPTVFLDQGYISEDKIDMEYLRWLYTALTRGIDKVYLVNFNDMFFQ